MAQYGGKGAPSLRTLTRLWGAATMTQLFRRLLRRYWERASSLGLSISGTDHPGGISFTSMFDTFSEVLADPRHGQVGPQSLSCRTTFPLSGSLFTTSRTSSHLWPLVLQSIEPRSKRIHSRQSNRRSFWTVTWMLPINLSSYSRATAMEV